MAKVMSALLDLLEVNSNKKGGTQELHRRTMLVKLAISSELHGTIREKLERILNKMAEMWVAKTPGSWKPYVVCCLEALADESGAAHVLNDLARIDEAKKSMRITAASIKEAKQSFELKQPRSVMKQLLKTKQTTPATLAILRGRAHSSGSFDAQRCAEQAPQQTAKKSDAAALVRAVMSCSWPSDASEQPGSKDLLAVARAIGWDISTDSADLAAALRKQYRLAAVLCHPDKFPELRSYEAFYRIQTTNEILGRVLHLIGRGRADS